jgi:hypothetical protein
MYSFLWTELLPILSVFLPALANFSPILIFFSPALWKKSFPQWGENDAIFLGRFSVKRYLRKPICVNGHLKNGKRIR